MKTRRRQQSGFTLIEVMIASALFVVIMVLGIGGLLSVYKTYQVNRGMREIVDNLNTVMEDMSRNIRLGRDFTCLEGSQRLGSPDINGTQVIDPDRADCSSPKGYTLYFKGQEADVSVVTDRIIYSFTPADDGDWTKGVIVKSRNGGISYAQITTPGVVINMAQSGFIVIGSSPTDSAQPLILIKIVGSFTYKDVTIPFNIQSTVTSRDLDLDVTTTP
jgi:prepilin-type N-terminal cleavage/methylation domain-containing protein